MTRDDDPAMTATIPSTLRPWHALVGAGAMLLAAHPAAWLVRTWMDPSWDSHGAWIAAAVAALVAWSVSSERVGPGGTQRFAWILLAVSAAVRLAGQVLAVNVLGALALPLDILALAHLLGLPDRQRPLSAGWLAALFALALPLERILQRVAGYGLQLASATASEPILAVFFHDVRREGSLLVVDGVQANVDLPCSGARGLIWLLVLACAAAAIIRPTARQALAGLALAAGGAFVANIARITGVAAGLARPDLVLGIDVAAGSAHELIGLAGLAIGSAPLFIGIACVTRRGGVASRARAGQRDVPAVTGQLLAPTRWAPLLATGFLLAALAITLVPGHPVDVSRAVDEPWLPASLHGVPVERVELTPREARYFTKHGGVAIKARCGALSLLVVRTTAPLRHLHSPDECLRGAGWRVDPAGFVSSPLPSARYDCDAPDGTRVIVRVGYVSDRGETATSPAEAAWRWLAHRDATWTSIQRSAPEGSQRALDEVDAILAQAFDAPRADQSRMAAMSPRESTGTEPAPAASGGIDKQWRMP